MSKRKAIMELLFLTINKKDKEELEKIVLTYTSFCINLPTRGSLEGIESFWNLDASTQESLVAIIPKSKTKEILSRLEAVLSLKDKHQGIAFTIPFDSASTNLVKNFEKGESKWKQ